METNDRVHKAARDILRANIGGVLMTEDVVPILQDFLTTHDQSLHTSLVAAVEHDREMYSCYEGCKCRSRVKDIINSIFKE